MKMFKKIVGWIIIIGVPLTVYGGMWIVFYLNIVNDSPKSSHIKVGIFVTVIWTILILIGVPIFKTLNFIGNLAVKWTGLDK